MQSPADDAAEPAVPDAPRPSADPTIRSLWNRRRIVVPVVAVVALVAATVAAAGILYQAVVMPILGDPANSSTIYYSDGTVLAHLDRARTQALRWDQFSDVVGQTAVAAQDPDFWTDEGGALTRSVVRIGAQRTQPHSVLSRARLWVGARKLDEVQTKQNILEYFLNAVPLGRATFGVEAAAQVYFGKTARRDAGPAEALTVAEAMVLMALLDAPEDYDPVRTPATSANSHRRWAEIRDAMRDNGYLSASAAAALAYPTTARADTPTAWPTAASGPAGLVVPHVVAELAAMPQFAHLTYGQLATAGLKIMSTVSSPAQRLLEQVADGPAADSVMSGQPVALAAAAVVVEPRTGRVLAYYGGGAGNGADYAATYVDDTGARVGFGAHPAGGMFGVHVLAAGLQAGMSVQSRWSPAVVDLPGRAGANAVRNTSVCDSPCTLAKATTVGFNTTMYQVTLSTGPEKVLEAVRDAGIGALYSADHTRIELVPGPLASLVPGPFTAEVALGRYAVTVADEAVAMAGYAGLSHAVTGHFVLKVLRDDRVLAAETVPAPGLPFLDTGRANDLTWVLSQSPAAKLDNGWPSALKTGSYPAESADAPTDAWAVGYTTTLAVAVWVGNRATVAPLRDREGKAVFGTGLPAQIYRAFLNAAPDALRLPSPPAPFPAPAFVGNAFPPGSQR